MRLRHHSCSVTDDLEAGSLLELSLSDQSSSSWGRLLPYSSDSSVSNCYLTHSCSSNLPNDFSLPSELESIGTSEGRNGTPTPISGSDNACRLHLTVASLRQYPSRARNCWYGSLYVTTALHVSNHQHSCYCLTHTLYIWSAQYYQLLTHGMEKTGADS